MSDYKLTRLEQETIINFNNEEDHATVYTCNRPLINRLQKLSENDPVNYKLIREDKYSKTYRVNKDLITIRKARTYTDEHKQKMKERGAAARANLARNHG
ncbi:MAG: hypothetical protein ACOYJ1_05770 [Peptococcales bacterium]|jgi:hypothetical protein